MSFRSEVSHFVNMCSSAWTITRQCNIFRLSYNREFKWVGFKKIILNFTFVISYLWRLTQKRVDNRIRKDQESHVIKVENNRLAVSVNFFFLDSLFFFSWLKGHSHNCVQIYWFFFKFYCLQCFRNASTMIYQSFIDSRRVIRKIQSSHFFVM